MASGNACRTASMGSTGSSRDEGQPQQQQPVPLSLSMEQQLVGYPLKSDHKKVPPLPRLLRKREFHGKTKPFNVLYCQVRLDQMKCPYPMKIGRVIRLVDIARECIFIGLSADSRYAVALMWQFTGLLPPQFRVASSVFPHWHNNAQIYATFPSNSSHISVVGFSRQKSDRVVVGTTLTQSLEPFSTVAQVRFILFRLRICISLSACIVISYRWQSFKMSRIMLRSTDHGGILNAGTALISYLFTKDCPIVTGLRLSRTVLQIVDRKVVEDAEERILEGCNSQDIKVTDSRIALGDIVREYGLKRVTSQDRNPSSAGLTEPLFFSETVLDIERLLYEIIPVIVSRMQNNYKFIGLIDYEVDLLDCDGYNASVLIIAVVEATGPGETGKNSPYIVSMDIVWNILDGTIKANPWKVMRRVDWGTARRPDMWYPFFLFSRIPKAPDQRMLSNTPLLQGKTMELISSPFPGISICRELPDTTT